MPDQASTAILSTAQIETLRAHGEERAAAAGETLFAVGDRTYPLIVILEGEAAVFDPSGEEIVRQGPGEFLGEVGLLSGQTVYLTARAATGLRYIAVDRHTLRGLLFEDGALGDTLLTTFNARREEMEARPGVGLEVLGPRGSHPTRQLVDWLRRNRIPLNWREPEEDAEAAAALAEAPAEAVPLVRIPGGPELRNPTAGDLSRTLGIGLELKPREEVDLVVLGGGPAGLGAAVYGASEGLDTLVIECTALGGQAGTSRRIENYLGFPAGISGSELTGRAITQARKFGARSATPYRVEGLECDGERHHVLLENDHRVSAKAVVLATGATYRRLPVDDIADYEGTSIFYAAGPPEARRCTGARVAVIGGGNSAGQAAVWLARGGALTTLLHRRADLSETMSEYLLEELDRYGVQVRGGSEVAELHGDDGELEAVTLKDGERLPFGFVFCFLGAEPCTDWLGEDIARDEKGFVLTGADAGATGLLETSVPGIYAAGDVRSGSVKRCATAVGEGAMVVRFVHERLSGVPA